MHVFCCIDGHPCDKHKQSTSTHDQRLWDNGDGDWSGVGEHHLLIRDFYATIMYHSVLLKKIKIIESTRGKGEREEEGREER